jgi:hypothetical protein
MDYNLTIQKKMSKTWHTTNFCVIFFLSHVYNYEVTACQILQKEDKEFLKLGHRFRIGTSDFDKIS